MTTPEQRRLDDLLKFAANNEVPKGFAEHVDETVGALMNHSEEHLDRLDEQRVELAERFEDAYTALVEEVEPIQSEEHAALTRIERSRRAAAVAATMPFRLIDIGRTGIALALSDAERFLVVKVRDVMLATLRAHLAKTFKVPDVVVDLYVERVKDGEIVSNVVTLSEEAMKKVADAIANPPPPTEALVDAMRRYGGAKAQPFDMDAALKDSEQPLG